MLLLPRRPSCRCHVASLFFFFLKRNVYVIKTFHHIGTPSVHCMGLAFEAALWHFVALGFGTRHALLRRHPNPIDVGNVYGLYTDKAERKKCEPEEVDGADGMGEEFREVAAAAPFPCLPRFLPPPLRFRSLGGRGYNGAGRAGLRQHVRFWVSLRSRISWPNNETGKMRSMHAGESKKMFIELRGFQHGDVGAGEPGVNIFTSSVIISFLGF